MHRCHFRKHPHKPFGPHHRNLFLCAFNCLLPAWVSLISPASWSGQSGFHTNHRYAVLILSTLINPWGMQTMRRVEHLGAQPPNMLLQAMQWAGYLRAQPGAQPPKEPLFHTLPTLQPSWTLHTITLFLIRRHSFLNGICFLNLEENQCPRLRVTPREWGATSRTPLSVFVAATARGLKLCHEALKLFVMHY
jgi:hypothetical protein